MSSIGNLSRAAAKVSAPLVVAFFAGSCASAKLEYIETGFSDTGVSGSKVSAAAVVDKAGAGITKGMASTMANQMTGQLRKKRRKADVVSLRNPRLVKSGISSSALRSVARAGGQSDLRYAMVIEITGNRISQRVSCTESDNTEPIYNSEGEEVGCRVVSTDYTTTSITTRKMQACYKLMDLITGKSIWVTSTSHSESNSKSCTDSFDHPPAPPFPPPPVIVDVTENMTRAAIRKLPRK